jgi:hypothetical protein
MPSRRIFYAVLGVALACAPSDEGQPDALRSDSAEMVSAPACSMPTGRTTVRAQDGAILEAWDLSLQDVLTDRLPHEPAFLEYRAAIERDSADLRRPVADPPLVDTEELAAIWRDEFFNSDLVFDEGVGSVEPISCLDALLFARQAARISQLEQPTEFSASVLRRDAPEGTRVRVVFAAGSEMFVPRGFYGFDLVGDYQADGWDYWYAIHNHTIQRNGSRLALGVPVPSTSDVQLIRSLAARLGLDSARVTNGFYTFNAAVEELSQFRAR